MKALRALKSRLTSADDSVPLVIWTFAEPVVIIIAASVPIFRFFLQTPAQPDPRRRLLEENGGAALIRSYCFPPSARLGRGTNTWSITGGPFDTAIPLQLLSGGRDSIMRTDEIRIGVEENGGILNREDNKSRASLPSVISRLEI